MLLPEIQFISQHMSFPGKYNHFTGNIPRHENDIGTSSSSCTLLHLSKIK